MDIISLDTFLKGRGMSQEKAKRDLGGGVSITPLSWSESHAHGYRCGSGLNTERAGGSADG